jgi:glutamate/tyrosine decarboxylase-like PLP-dependent enzyme
METQVRSIVEESLDPADWREIEGLGHRMVDDLVHYLETVRSRPAWQPMPEPARRALHEPLPREPQGAERVYEDFRSLVLPYPTGNIHPRFWGWVMGTGSAVGMLAELLAAGMNSNVWGMDQSATVVELQVLGWLREMLGFPPGSGGLLLDGGSMANVLGLAVARNARAGFDLRFDGLAGGPRMTLYTSVETHSSVRKAVELLGLGNRALRLVPAGKDRAVDVEALAALVAADRHAGLRPIAVVANAGTVNTGAIDDLERLADLCGREGLWLHVDGAIGAPAVLSPGLRPALRGLERADSLALDLHKWMYMPYDIGCLLVRSAEEHRNAFAYSPAYLTPTRGGVYGGGFTFADYGPQLSRSFRALKVWMCLKAYGANTFARLIEQNVEQARHLARLVEQSPELELLAPVPLNIVCFRFVAPELDEARLNALNERILVQLQENGTAVPSSTALDGRLCLRVAITNHRTRREDLELLVREVLRLGHTEVTP